MAYGARGERIKLKMNVYEMFLKKLVSTFKKKLIINVK